MIFIIDYTSEEIIDYQLSYFHNLLYLIRYYGLTDFYYNTIFIIDYTSESIIE